MSTETKTNTSTGSNYLSNFRLFNGGVWLNFSAWFVLQFCFAGIYAVLLNLYLMRSGFGIDFIGMVNTAGALGFAVFAIPAGVLGARFGYRPMIMLGFLGGAVFSATLLLSGALGSALQGPGIILSYGLFSLSMTLIAVNVIPFLASAVNDEARVHVFSVYGAIAPLAGFFGSIIAGYLPDIFAGFTGSSLEEATPYAWPLWLVPVLFFIFLALFVFLTKGGVRQSTGSVQTEKLKEKAPVNLFVTMFLITVLRISSFYALFAFFSVYLDSALKVSTATIGLLTALGRIIPVPAALLTPLMVEKTGKFKLIILLSLISAVFVLPIGFFPYAAAAAISLIFISGANAVTSSAFTTLHQEVTPEKWRSQMAGSVFCAEAISYGLMAFFGGFMIKSLGYQSFFLVSAVTTLLSALLFWALLKNKAARL